MAGWRRRFEASSLYGRGGYDAAAAICEALLRADPDDVLAAFMLAGCYERQGRLSQAFHWAEVVAAKLPNGLEALQSAARLAVANGDHEKATQYVLRALALPEVRSEMPRDGRSEKFLRCLIRVLIRMPFVGRRFRPDALDELQPERRAFELQQWKKWAQAYIAWRNGNEEPTPRRS